jgi:glycosyltransferase involved in cell wall biosynthesis
MSLLGFRGPTAKLFALRLAQPEIALVSKPGAGKIVIGWSGSSSTNIYVNDVVPVLNRLALREEFLFLVISNDLGGIDQDRMKGYEFRFIEWDKNREVKNLQKMDIGLMPLRHDPWARGKCALKALQYMAIGIPVVSSPVGVNADIIQDGINGFLADTEEEWFQKLEFLIKNPEARRQAGQKARAAVEKEYSIAIQFPRFKECLENIFEEKLAGHSR